MATETAQIGFSESIHPGRAMLAISATFFEGNSRLKP